MNTGLGTPISTSNSFDVLSDPGIEVAPQAKPVKSPPIFVDKVSNIQPLIKLLNDVAKDSCEIKVLKDEEVKIQPLGPIQ